MSLLSKLKKGLNIDFVSLRVHIKSVKKYKIKSVGQQLNILHEFNITHMIEDFEAHFKA